MSKKSSKETSTKLDDLNGHKETGVNELMTTNQGLLINDDQNSLTSGVRGGTLMEDFILREKITHFDHERIPERIVHARGSGAHGVFRLHTSLARHTKAKFLNDTEMETPVFVRFSTVAGSRGSADLARDARGFAVKFYTTEGNYDLVGNNMPVFFIQDAIKFPDLIHAVKPEPNNEIPQASSAHDTFWDFISLMPESAHMVMWTMSDRAIPRSYRMMEGFGVHTFRLINEAGEASFVKFHWKPLLGVHSVAWEEAQQISGKDADFHRRDLWDAIESGAFPEWELGVQIVPEADEHKYDFDLLDPTKLIPEELVPVQLVGTMTLNRNPDNFFAETEQIAFHPGHLVPGIDFSNDPLLQGRLFSYTDTQLSRLGGPNFHEIPINRPIAPVHNNQRDGIMRQQISKDVTSYNPNSIGGGCPYQAKAAQGGFTSYTERIDGHKVRERSKSFYDHFSQATMFYNSQSDAEKNHIINALRFELSKVNRVDIRQRMLNILGMIDKAMATDVASALGLQVQKPEQPINHSVPADGLSDEHRPIKNTGNTPTSPALSMANTQKDTIATRQIAILMGDGVDVTEAQNMAAKLKMNGANATFIASRLGKINGADGQMLEADKTLFNTSSVLYDAVYIPGGSDNTDSLIKDADALFFISQAYKHCKAIATDTESVKILERCHINKKNSDKGLITNGDADAFIAAIAGHRYWQREQAAQEPA